jgi:hypothetical protein
VQQHVRLLLTATPAPDRKKSRAKGGAGLGFVP